MNFKLGHAWPLVVVVEALLLSVAAQSGCSASSGGSACAALVTCCNFTDVPSSCAETAMTTLTESQCAAELQKYEQSGVCPVDGGTGDARTQ